MHVQTGHLSNVVTLPWPNTAGTPSKLDSWVDFTTFYMFKYTHLHPDSPLHVKRPTDPRSVPAGVGPASSSLFLSSSLPSPLSHPPPPTPSSSSHWASSRAESRVSDISPLKTPGIREVRSSMRQVILYVSVILYCFYELSR